MQVTIRNRKYDFDIRSLNGKWKTQQGTFAFPVEIGGVNCFIKKFDTKIESETLYRNLKGKEVVNIPRVYDVQYSQDKELLVFQSFNPGSLLDEKLRNAEFRSKLNVSSVCSKLFSAIRQINSEGYWHNDICYLNIQVEDNGNYLLLDIDSCYPLKKAVSINALINKSLFGIFNNYLYKYHGIIALKEKSFDGAKYNLLQLASLLTFLQYLKDNPNEKYNSALESNSDLIADYIALRHSKVEDLFIKGVTEKLTEKDFEDFVKYLPFQKDRLSQPVLTPTIKKLTLNGGTDCLIDKGNSVTVNTISIGTKCSLMFEFENATKIILRFNNKNPQHFESSKGKFEFTLNQDANIEIYASNRQKNGEKYKIAIKPLVVAKKPVINIFQLTQNKIGYRESTILKWNVSDATHLSISNVGLSLPLIGEKTISYLESDKEFVLDARNEVGNDVKQIKKSIYLSVALPPLLKPTINIFEINGQKTTNITLNKGQSYDIKWNVSNATKVLLNGGEQKNIGLISRILSKNETLILEAYNIRGNEQTKVKSSPRILTIREKYEPTVAPPEIVDFGIAIDEKANPQNPSYTHLFERNYNNVSGATYFYFRINNAQNAKVYLAYNGKQTLVNADFSNTQFYYLPINENNNNLINGKRTAKLIVKYVDTWEKQITKEINFTLKPTIAKPIIKYFFIDSINNRRINNIDDGQEIRVPNSSEIEFSWETENCTNVFLDFGNNYKEEIPKSGTNSRVFTNNENFDIERKLSLSATNSEGKTVTKKIQFVIEKERKPYVFNWLFFVIILFSMFASIFLRIGNYLIVQIPLLLFFLRLNKYSRSAIIKTAILFISYFIFSYIWYFIGF